MLAVIVKNYSRAYIVLMHMSDKEAAARVGGVAQLANRLGITQSAIYQWEEVPVERVADLERLTGLPRSHFRPDIFPAVSESVIDNRSAYDHDYYAWLNEQVAHLREQRFSVLDVTHLIDEIE